VVELALVVAGSVEAFDEDNFKDGLAKSLGVKTDALNLAVTSASLRVVASIDVDEDGAASVISALASRTSNITALGNLLGVVVESANETVWTIATVRAPSPARAAEIASELNDATKASESLGVTVLEAQEPAVAVSLVAAPSPPHHPHLPRRYRRRPRLHLRPRLQLPPLLHRELASREVPTGSRMPLLQLLHQLLRSSRLSQSLQF
jgi:hypothetical protein